MVNFSFLPALRFFNWQPHMELPYTSELFTSAVTQPNFPFATLPAPYYTSPNLSYTPFFDLTQQLFINNKWQMQTCLDKDSLPQHFQQIPFSALTQRTNSYNNSLPSKPKEDFSNTSDSNKAKKILQRALSFKDYSASKMAEIMKKADYPYHSAWCADFVSFILGTSIGKENLPGWYKNIHNKAWVGNILKAARKANKIVTERQGKNIDISRAKPGDIIIFDWNGDSTGNDDKTDHIGFVKEVKGNSLIAIEGNNGRKVSERKYTPQGNSSYTNTRSIHSIIRVC